MITTNVYFPIQVILTGEIILFDHIETKQVKPHLVENDKNLIVQNVKIIVRHWDSAVEINFITERTEILTTIVVVIKIENSEDSNVENTTESEDYNTEIVDDINIDVIIEIKN